MSLNTNVPGPLDVVFTQFMRPDGHTKQVWVQRPADVVALAKAVIEAGGRFEIESLTTGDVSMAVEVGDGDDGPVAMEVCANGPAVLDAVDRLVRDAAARLGCLAQS